MPPAHTSSFDFHENPDSHIPVLLTEVLAGVNLQPGQNAIDATFGRGGHSRAMLERIRPGGKLLVIDADPKAIAYAEKLGNDVVARLGNFADLKEHIAYGVPRLPIHAVLFDCGISSAQLADSSLGLSFTIDGPLDMRLDRSSAMTAATIVNEWSEMELTKIIRAYGEEAHARKVARAIIAARPLTTTTALADVIAGALGRRGKIHPATKTFQALRIAVNNEMENLKQGISAALNAVAVGGRVAVISFHSLEDRIAKNMFREAAKVCHCPPGLLRCTCGRRPEFQLLTKKPIIASDQEVRSNPRSRSAKLRVIERLYVA